jgi:hypothetical protein
MPNRKFSKGILLLLCISLCGCGSLLRVTKFDKDNPQGVPFFVKRGVCVQQSVYANPYWQLTFTYTPSEGQPTSEVLIISEAAYGKQDFSALLAELKLPVPNYGGVKTAWDTLKDANSFNPWVNFTGQRLLSNSSSLTSEVDYHTVYAINQKKPFSGSSQADFKLASDGTLNEASGQAQDNTFATIVSALPIASLITSAAGIVGKGGPQEAVKPVPAKFVLKQEQRYIKIVYSKSTVAPDGVCAVGDALIKGNDVAVAITDVGSTNTPDASTQDKNTDSISISGTIKIPKSNPPPTVQNGSDAPKPVQGGQPIGKDQPAGATGQQPKKN